MAIHLSSVSLVCGDWAVQYSLVLFNDAVLGKLPNIPSDEPARGTIASHCEGQRSVVGPHWYVFMNSQALRLNTDWQDELWCTSSPSSTVAALAFNLRRYERQAMFV
jgi:hypothetical protein